MDCKNAELLLLFHRPDRPHDLVVEESRALQDHLATCPSCAAQFSQQSAQDRAIGAVMRSVAAPAGFNAKLKERATADLKAAGRRTLTKYALAATLLLATYGLYAYVSRPYLNVDRLSEIEDSLWQAPQQSTSDWLAENGLSSSMPAEYELNLATFCGRRNLLGIPTLAVRLDATTRNRAWVYFVRSRDFNLSKLDSGQATSNVAVRVHSEPGSKWTVVVVYTGNNLSAFLNNGGA